MFYVRVQFEDQKGLYMYLMDINWRILEVRKIFIDATR